MAFAANSSHNRIYSVSGETWVGRTFPTQNNGTLTAASIAFNSGLNTFTVGAASGKYDIQTIAAHELGHAIGVAHCHEKNETLDLNSHYRSQINIDKVCVVAVDDFIGLIQDTMQTVK